MNRILQCAIFVTIVCGVIHSFLTDSVYPSVTWLSDSTLRNSSTVPACLGQDLDLPWSYQLKISSAHVIAVAWFFQRPGQTASSLIATLVENHFFTEPTATQNMQFISNAGIRLLNLQSHHSGTYSVYVNVQGQNSADIQSVVLQVTSSSAITSSSSLTVTMEPLTEFSPVTNQDHLVLSCGTFSSLWDSKVNAYWRTPSQRPLLSTVHTNGHFYLNIPNPLENGNYSCFIDTTSPVMSCISNFSPLRQGASYYVDAAAGTIRLLEAHVERLENTFRIHDDVRLVNGFNAGDGRVEVRLSRAGVIGSWGTVCDDYWDKEDAQVVCRQLSLPGTFAKAWPGAKFGSGSGDILMDDVNCLGTEGTLADCSFLDFEHATCGHGKDAGVTCCNLSLSGGSRGRVQIQIGSTSGTICDDNWDVNDAKVVCRMLGYPHENAMAWTNASFGQGSGAILLDDVGCTGNELHILDCHNGGYGVHDCSHGEDAGVTCI